MKIVVCDDDEAVAKALVSHCRRLGTELDMQLDIASFFDGAALVDNYHTGADLVLLDVEMPLTDGLSAASELRRRDAAVNIVFVTSYERYAVSGYRVGAYRYLVKPVSYEAFAEELSGLFVSIVEEKGCYLDLRTDRGFLRVRPNDVIYIESCRDHKIRVHLKSESVVARKSMDEVAAVLPDTSFYRCHRSCLVNLSHISLLASAEVQMSDGSKVPVSKHRKAEFQAAFARYAARTALSPA